MKDHAVVDASCHSMMCNHCRRDVLRAALGLGLAVAASPFGSVLAARPDDGLQGIDVHHHFLPPFYIAKKSTEIMNATAGQDPKRILGWTPQVSLAQLDAANISRAMISISTPGVWFGNAEEARALARDCNEYGAGLVVSHPGRFGLLAALPFPDIDGTLREIAYAYDVLKASGVGILTSYDGKWPGDPVFAPIFEDLNRRRAIVYVHPTTPGCCGNLVPNVGSAVVEYPFDTTRAILSLLYSGTLARYQNIRFIFSHGGGTIPMTAGRIMRSFARQKFAKDVAPRGAEYEFKKLYFDTAGTANAASMAALLTFTSVSQVMFGSDTPYQGVGQNLADLAGLNLSKADFSAIMRDNAGRLFSRGVV